MPSYVYFASGEINGKHVMKVGKSNNPQRRVRQVKLSLEAQRECISEEKALQLEFQILGFILSNGGIRIGTSSDWFEYDNLWKELPTPPTV